MLPYFQHWSNQAHPAQFQRLYAYRHRVWTKAQWPHPSNLANRITPAGAFLEDSWHDQDLIFLQEAQWPPHETSEH